MKTNSAADEASGARISAREDVEKGERKNYRAAGAGVLPPRLHRPLVMMAKPESSDGSDSPEREPSAKKQNPRAQDQLSLLTVAVTQFISMQQYGLSSPQHIFQKF